MSSSSVPGDASRKKLASKTNRLGRRIKRRKDPGVDLFFHLGYEVLSFIPRTSFGRIE